jgi:hypothetical protein
VLFLIDYSPLPVAKCLRGFLDRKISQSVVGAGLRFTIGHVNGWCRQDTRVDNHRLGVDYHTPIFESFLTEEVMREFFDRLELLLRILPAGSEDISHFARIFSDGLRHSVNSAELGRNVTVLTIDLDDEERLLQVSHFQIVVLREVLSNAKFLAIMSLESHSHWSLLEIDIFDEVSLFVTVGANHSLELKLVEDL